MSGWSNLDAFLRTDPRDVGCGEVMRILHVYAELAQADPAAARRAVPGRGRPTCAAAAPARSTWTGCWPH